MEISPEIKREDDYKATLVIKDYLEGNIIRKQLTPIAKQ